MADTGNTNVSRGWQRWFGRTLRYGPATFFPVTSAIGGAVAGFNHGAVRVYWTIGAVLSIATSAILNGVRERQALVMAGAALNERTRLARAVASAGEPLVTALGNVVTAKTAYDRKAAADVLIRLTVDVAAQRCGRDSTVKCAVRSVFYALSGDRLVRTSWSGRQGDTKPRRDFERGRSDHDNEAVHLAEGEEVLVVEDLESRPPAHFIDNKGRPYKAFIAVPVRAGDVSCGLLIVDSDRAQSLTEVDRGYLVVLAGVLAAGLAGAVDAPNLVVAAPNLVVAAPGPVVATPDPVVAAPTAIIPQQGYVNGVNQPTVQSQGGQ